MVNVGKRKMADFREKWLISKEISFHALIKKNNYKSFHHAMPKIRITKKDVNVKVAKVNRSLLGTFLGLKIGKSVVFEKALSYSLFPWWKSSTYTKEQIQRYFTARPRRSYQWRTTVSSRKSNFCKYYCINKYHP